MAERGINATTEDFSSMTNGLAQALNGNFASLTKMGFVLDDTTKKMLTHGTEMERVTALAGVLDSTYKGANEGALLTFEGRMKNIQMQMGKVKEGIGGALVPSLELLVSKLFAGTKGVNENGKGFEVLGNIIYRITNVILAFGQAVKMTFQMVIEWVGVLVTAFKALAGVVEPIALAFQGKFKEAKEAMQQNMSEGLDSVMEKVKTAQQRIQDSSSKIGEYMVEAFTAKNFKPVEAAWKGIQATGTAAADSTKQTSEEMKKALDDLAGKYKDFAKDTDDALFQLEQSHQTTLSSLRQEISKISDEINKAQEEYNNQKKSDDMGIAGEIVKNEERIAAIQTELQGKVSTERQAELQAELDQRLLAMQNNATFIQQFEQQIAEVRRRNALTDLERAIEDYKVKRDLAQKEFNEKMARLQQELATVQQKEREEMRLYEEKHALIVKTIEDAAKLNKNASEANLRTTKDAIEKEIAYYKELAEAIKAARSANTAEFARISTRISNIGTSVTQVNDAVVSPTGRVISTAPDDWIIATKNPQSLGGSGGSVSITITGNTFMGEEDLAEQVGDKIISILKNDMRITS